MGILKGKTAVVTGSTSGIGLAYARAFAAAGANVVINGFGAPADIEKERSGIETDYKVKALYSSADMTKPAEIAEMIALGEKTFGSVDILVNNAGRSISWSTMPASSSCRRSRNSRSKSGMRSSRSTCRRHFMPSAPRCPA
jgi:NAD(P)-dependent dehydrogenase (short-subunit alcohol dehydrogenase family)